VDIRREVRHISITWIYRNNNIKIMPLMSIILSEGYEHCSLKIKKQEG
jgi:hypothetical protein